MLITINHFLDYNLNSNSFSLIGLTEFVENMVILYSLLESEHPLTVGQMWDSAPRLVCSREIMMGQIGL